MFLTEYFFIVLKRHLIPSGIHWTSAIPRVQDIAPREQDKLFLHQVRSLSRHVVCTNVDCAFRQDLSPKRDSLGVSPSTRQRRSLLSLLCSRSVSEMEGTLLQSSCNTERLYWDGGTFTPVLRHWFTRSRSRGHSPMGMLKLPSPESILICLCRVFLVTVHDPICTKLGNLADTLYGSFLPVPSNDLFPTPEPSVYAQHALPGAVITKNECVVINQGRERVRIKVTNNGDQPVQVSTLSTYMLHPT